ncbi:hypothetical protein M2451_000127 [Dysgonomonas sp. PFB1-18]|uniref:hypothetical protein n=1 Tax=unclassified Dysgonomonas TaxID=2630389 RepID=UPI0024741AEC|nr:MULTISPECIES: hypothetical protein [unclassified Dysgonomonas]MDH6307678.1 hypothetical protein [Dysgonomonas sp. PF1-14]MDH6337596.1 hypothetical protein [Dysgonomonas sp. PF1-16]MDH6378820.1 hypothetical protein [Dysgonomonas sp. PFB1-18]MDH6396455.1 hypothetical protein [Dysgonomonas sp. PF1-23]
MDTNEIKILLEAFYNGETSQAEEQKLLDYFNSDNVAEELFQEKELFLKLNEPDTINYPQELEFKLNNLIDDLARKESVKPAQNKQKLWLWAGSAAAGVALLISAGLYINNKTEEVTNTDITAAAPEDRLKMEEAREALILLSSNFNKGVSQLEIISENIDKTHEILNKTIN